MGSTVSLDWSQDVESEAKPGTKCVSATLPEGLEPNALWDEVVMRMKDPITGMLRATVLKSTEVEEHDGNPDHYSVRIVMDGVKMDSWGKGPKSAGEKEGTNFIPMWFTTKCDREHNFMETFTYINLGTWEGGPRDNKDVEWNVRTWLVGNPLRIESQSQLPDGEIIGDARALLAVKEITERSLAAIQKRKVRALPSQDSLTTPGEKSVLTDAMDEFMTPDDFFIKCVEKIKKQSTSFHQKHEIKIDEEGKFKFTFPMPRMGFEEESTANEEEGIHEMTYDEYDGWLDVSIQIRGNTIENHYRTHRDPLRLEMWQVVDGKRVAERGVSVIVQGLVDEIIETSQSWFGGWLG